MTRILAIAAWLTVGLLFAGLICEPVSLQAHFVICCTALAGMLAIKLLRLGGAWRQLFLALASGIVFRYFFWRTTSTLPPTSDMASFVCGALLWTAELYSIAMLVTSLFVVAAPLQRNAAPRLKPDDLPTVDVFVPTYNEDKDLLAVTLAAATAMHYPADKLRVHLLDDGGTDQKCNADDPAKAKAALARRAELRTLATDIGAIYHTRERNDHAKAGNLNAGLSESNGDLVVVFDADHVPMPDFLNETVGHFAQDPKLFLCQTPHFFSNPDPIERNLKTFQVMPSENEMFYGTIQRGLDKWNAAFFCGSAAVLRRAALEEVGGFSGITITEDCETALDLHSRGWTSLYVDKPMISGLQPDTFASFIGQRSRWARGMFQIFLLKNPLFKSGLSLGQRICYFSNMSYWFFPLFRLPFLFAPFLYIWFSLQIYVANVHEFFAYTMMYMLANMLIQSYLYGNVRWPLVSELYEFVQTFYLSRGLLSVIANPRKPTFNVTDKGQSLDKDFLSELAMPFFVMFAALLISQVYAGYRFFTEPEGNDLLAVVSLWNFLNLLLCGAALGVVAERRAEPKDIAKPAELAIGTAMVPASLMTLSPGGCRLRLVPGSTLPATMSVGTSGVLNIPLRASFAEARTMPVVLDRLRPSHGDGQMVDLSFPALKAEHYRLIATVLHPGSAALATFRGSRRQPKSILAGIVRFAAWGLAEPFRGIAALYRHARAEPAVSIKAEPTGLMPSTEAPVSTFPASRPLPMAVGIS